MINFLDPVTRREWENAISDSAEPAKYDELQEFLTKKIRALEVLECSIVTIKTDKQSYQTKGGKF